MGTGSTQLIRDATLKVCPGLPLFHRDTFNGDPPPPLEDLTSFGAAPYRPSGAAPSIFQVQSPRPCPSRAAPRPTLNMARLRGIGAAHAPINSYILMIEIIYTIRWID
jgi:hypothetical protein